MFGRSLALEGASWEFVRLIALFIPNKIHRNDMLIWDHL